MDEVVREGSERRALLSEYSDLDGSGHLIDVYTATEILAEKVRSLMQRSEPRDPYDLHTSWRTIRRSRATPRTSSAGRRSRSPSTRMISSRAWTTARRPGSAFGS